jgi:hypothetical protein
MAFFDDLGKKLGSAANAAADKAKEIAEITRLNSAVSAEERQIQQNYLEIGKLIFEWDQSDPNSPVAEYCAKITASLQTIQELKEKIEQVRSDGAPQAVQSSPAPQAAAPAGAGLVCQSCGSLNPATSKFCLNCGSSLAGEKHRKANNLQGFGLLSGSREPIEV